MKSSRIPLFVLLILLLAGLACSSDTEPVAEQPTLAPTNTAAPIDTPRATNALPPKTDTPQLTATLPPTETSTLVPQHTEAKVIRVIDGDTIEVSIDGQSFTVRYIGIDTPETVHPSKPIEWMGPEASALNAELVQGQIAGAEGRWDEALAAFKAASGIFARYDARWYWARWLLDWAEAHAARGELGDQERARELLQQSQAAFEEMGIPSYAQVARDRLEALEAAP